MYWCKRKGTYVSDEVLMSDIMKKRIMRLWLLEAVCWLALCRTHVYSNS